MQTVGGMEGLGLASPGLWSLSRLIIGYRIFPKTNLVIPNNYLGEIFTGAIARDYWKTLNEAVWLPLRALCLQLRLVIHSNKDIQDKDYQCLLFWGLFFCRSMKVYIILARYSAVMTVVTGIKAPRVCKHRRSITTTTTLQVLQWGPHQAGYVVSSTQGQQKDSCTSCRYSMTLCF